MNSTVNAARVGGLLTGRITDLPFGTARRLFERGSASSGSVESTVRSIIDDVRMRGDDALRDMALTLDGVTLGSIEVPRELWDRALDGMDASVRSALEEAAESIRVFHAAQIPADFEMEVRPGVRLGRRAEPLDRVGVYAPGGRAAYPSSVLMGVIPARIAGVREIIVCTPPGADGLPSPVVLAACAIANADRVFAIGGAGAIAALALGTPSVPQVARITGPGNAYVAEAKRQLTGVVSIDSPAGPSEVLVIADADADAELIAVELVAQAEHDPDAAAVAVIINAPALCAAVEEALVCMIAAQPRADIISASLSANGAVLLADTVDQAVAFAERYAPEHLSLMIASPREVLPRVRCAGTIFLGSTSSVAFGDYMTGANHVLPTNRLARSYSGLSSLDYLRFTTYQEVSASAAAAMSAPTSVLAIAEGLPAHALAASMRARVSTAGNEPPPRLRAGLRTRTAYCDIELYEPGRIPCDVDLSDNTNLHGVPPSARAVIERAPAPLVTRYPTVYARELKAALAKRHGVEPTNIVAGCGSDDILDATLRAFCNPGDVVAFPTPTFGVVDLFARMNAARPVAVPHAANLALDPYALADARAAVTYICNPNNPSGTLYSRVSIDALASAVEGVLVIDEAYADYAGVDCIDLVLKSDRAVVVRTFSKAFGLAGLRVGYAVGTAEIIGEIEKARGPYKVGALAEAAALAALANDTAWVREHVEEVRRNRDRLAHSLTAIGLPPLLSAANFLMVPLGAPGAAARWSSRLRAQGVAVRAFTALPSIGDALRVTIGPWPMMERFVNALRVLQSEQDSPTGLDS